MLKKILWGAGALLVLAASGFVLWMGPRNVIGMLRYDQRREGDLEVGDAAPDVRLVALDGEHRVSLAGHRGGKPLVLVFGSYT